MEKTSNIFKKKIFIIIIVLILIFVFSIFDIYAFKKTTIIGNTLSHIIPYPAIYINNNCISVGEYNKLSGIYKQYFYNNNAVKKEFIRDIILRYEISKKAMKDFDIEYSNNDFEQFVKNFYIENNVDQNKFDKNKLEQYIIKPAFFEKLISQKLSSNEYNKENKTKIENMYANLLKDPTLFDSYANTYKDNYVAFDNGILGWLPENDLPEDIREQIGDMKIGDFTPVKKSLAGYHIYKLISRIDNSLANPRYYQISQIFIPTMNFNLYFNDFIKNERIHFLLSNK